MDIEGVGNSFANQVQKEVETLLFSSSLSSVHKPFSNAYSKVMCRRRESWQGEQEDGKERMGYCLF